jgi:hypothetical protein
MMTVLEYLLESMDGLHQDLDTRALLSDVSADVLSIFTTICGIKSTLGSNDTSLFPDVWSGIRELSATSNSKSLEEITTMLNGMIENNTIMESHITINKAQWNSLLTNWLPVLAQQNTKMKNLQCSVLELAAKSMSLNPAAHQSANLDAELDSFLCSPPSEHVTLDSLDFLDKKFSDLTSALRGQITDVGRRLDIIEDHSNFRKDASWYDFERIMSHERHTKLGMSGVAYKNFYFHNEDKLKDWLKSNMTHPSHGLFVDIVSFSEFFGGDH